MMNIFYRADIKIILLRISKIFLELNKKFICFYFQIFILYIKNFLAFSIFNSNYKNNI